MGKEMADESIRNKWVHKIANLVPLTRPKNSAAQNYDFDQKKKIYFTGKAEQLLIH